ncbi:MAG: DUF4145 domain-containing protein [Clostridiales bacterium]|nr:DUF4145 domain-containing protein [Clostridiales bacterium]
MKRNITAIDLENDCRPILVKYTPETKCPLCHTSFDGSHLSAHVKSTEQPVLYILHFCHTCDRCFLSFYSKPYYLDEYTLKASTPRSHHEEQFSNHIVKLSPEFVEIYNQSSEAEHEGLSKICGMGYRKALEFLIKDFIIYKHPNDRDKIIKMSLSSCIDTHIDNKNIKELAIKSAWIGNDQTHYFKKHENRDIIDLKNFIEAVAYYISMELTVEDAQSIQPE